MNKIFIKNRDYFLFDEIEFNSSDLGKNWIEVILYSQGVNGILKEKITVLKKNIISIEKLILP